MTTSIGPGGRLQTTATFEPNAHDEHAGLAAASGAMHEVFAAMAPELSRSMVPGATFEQMTAAFEEAGWRLLEVDQEMLEGDVMVQTIRVRTPH